MKPPFIIYSLPRSRSAWVASFLSYDRKCGHDLAPQCASVRELVDLIQTDHAGTAETGAIVGWKALRKLMPDARIVVIRRPVQEVYDSLARFGLASAQLWNELHERDAMLDEVSKLGGVKSFTFADLCDVTACQELFEFCLDMPFDWEWWEHYAGRNIQVDVRAQIQYLIENRERIELLKRDAARLAYNADHVVIGREAWEALWPEIDTLFAEHFAEVEGDLAGQRPYNLDEPAMRAMCNGGHMRIVSARVNGELAGYCMWQVTKDVESAGLLIAQHGPWFVRPKFAAFMLGPKLFDASLDDLRSIGVKNAFPHHRLEGRGKKLGAFFKRRGAVETQHTYSLWLGERHA